MRRLILILLGVLACAAFALPSMASAASPSVKAVTHAQQHPDTANVVSPVQSGNGAVWAFDNLSIQLVATPENGPGNWSVTITTHGSFAALVNPAYGGAYSGNGNVDGTITYDVQAVGSPDPANVPAQQPQATVVNGYASGNTTLSHMIGQLFPDGATVAGGGSYTFSYNHIPGADTSGPGWTLVNGRYTQLG